MTSPEQELDVEYLKELDRPESLLLRQVHPQYVVDGEPNELAFRCTAADAGELSIAQDDKTEPKRACRDRHAQKPGSTAGTWAVSVAEVHELELRAWDDTDRPAVTDPAHGFVDYRGIITDKVRRRDVALILGQRAAARSALFRLP